MSTLTCRHHQRLTGVSLMETVVVIGVMSILMLMITQIFLLNYDIFFKQSKRADNETGAILAAKTITQAARGATSIEATHNFNGTDHASSADKLVLKTPAIDESGNVIAATYDYIAFYRHPADNQKIFIATDAAPSSYREDGNRLVTAYNETLIFRYNHPTITSAGRVSMLLINSQAQRDTTLTSRAWTSIFLRNLE